MFDRFRCLLCARTCAIFIALSLLMLSERAAFSQSFGEQRAVQFRYQGQGLTNEVYRRQFSAGAGGSSATSGTGQGSSALNNAIQTSSSLTLNVQGTGNTLNIVGDNVSGDQASTGTNQSNQNTQSSSQLLNR